MNANPSLDTDQLRPPRNSGDSDERRFDNGKTEHLAPLIAAQLGRRPERLLVVGCGTGREAAILRQHLGCEVIGIDIKPRFDAAAAAVADLQAGDATAMRFGDNSFDVVYSYHALEHIPNYRRALAEMHRVLRADGAYCIGTPNRSRLLGYLGSNNTPLKTKLAWNAADWRMRLTGRFRNECGAHAGFTAGELRRELLAVFSSTTDVSGGYYEAVYRRHASKVSLAQRTGLSRLLFPSVYFVGCR